MSSSVTFDLQSAKQLLEKAEHDLARLKKAPDDTYAAFDLFVTLRHIPNWIFPGEDAKANALFEKYPELRVCRHIADGAKHFALTAKHHRQVTATEKVASSWGGSWGKSWGSAWGENGLFIHLDSADPGMVSLGTKITALALGEQAIHLLKGLVL